MRVAHPWPTALVRVRQKAAPILRTGLRLRGGGTSAASPDNIRRRDDAPRGQCSCETDMRRSSGAEVAGPGLNDGDEMTASSEPMMENMSDLSDESLKDADLVFRDQEIQNEWLQFVEQGRSPTVKPRSHNSAPAGRPRPPKAGTGHGRPGRADADARAATPPPQRDGEEAVY